MAAPAVDSDGTPNQRARLVPQLHCTILGTAVDGVLLAALYFTFLRVKASSRHYDRYGEQVAEVEESSQHETHPK